MEDVFALIAGVVLAVLIVVAAVIDARVRRLPNPLALWLICTAAVGTAAVDGVVGFLHNVLIALVACAGLTLFELAWRYRRGESGQGMGDIKALFALMLADPLSGVFAYAAALVLLALSAIILQRKALPLLPFLAFMYLLIHLSRLRSGLL